VAVVAILHVKPFVPLREALVGVYKLGCLLQVVKYCTSTLVGREVPHTQIASILRLALEATMVVAMVAMEKPTVTHCTRAVVVVDAATSVLRWTPWPLGLLWPVVAVALVCMMLETTVVQGVGLLEAVGQMKFTREAARLPED